MGLDDGSRILLTMSEESGPVESPMAMKDVLAELVGELFFDNIGVSVVYTRSIQALITSSFSKIVYSLFLAFFYIAYGSLIL